MRSIDQSFVSGLVIGSFVTVLVALSALKVKDYLSPNDVPSIEPAMLIQSYKMGKQDALRTNPVSMELDEVCLSLWINKQPTQE